MSRKAVVLPLLILLATPQPALAEFYRYTDRFGRTHFVDELWKIPEEYRSQAGRYSEKYDHLPEEERILQRKADRSREEELEAERRRETERHLEELRQEEERIRARRAAEEERKRRKAEETEVEIAGNRILVPVKLGNHGLEAGVRLVLDTGASHTVIYRPVAERLRVLTLAKAQSRLAGGRTVHSEVGRLETFQVGPITMRDFPVVILPLEGEDLQHDGLLGMDFLQRVEYAVQYETSTIRWSPRSR